MTKSLLRIATSLFALCPLTVLLAAACGQSDTTDTPEAGGSSGTSGSGGAPSGGASSGSSGSGAPQGGSNASGTGGSAGVAAGSGSGGSAGGIGGESSGGAAGAGAGGTAGANAGGVAGTSGGSSGSGGGPTGVVGTLGGDCAPPGSLACAGNYQKLSLVCGADGTWAPNQTCSVGEFCDTTPGVNAGTCVPQAPGCEGLEPGARICIDQDVWECGPDTVTTAAVMTCEWSCVAGACSDVEVCPAASAYDCAGDCGGPDAECSECSALAAGTLRVGATCPLSCPNGSSLHTFMVVVFQFSPVTLRVSPPWSVSAMLYDDIMDATSDRCGLFSEGQACLQTPADWLEQTVAVFVQTDDPSPPPRNVTITSAETDPCVP